MEKNKKSPTFELLIDNLLDLEMRNPVHFKLTLYITVNFVLSAILYIAFPWLIIPTVIFMAVYIISRFPGNKLPEDRTSFLSEKS